MNPKRRSSPRTKQQTSPVRPNSAQPTTSPVSVPPRSFEAEAPIADEPISIGLYSGSDSSSDLSQGVELQQAMGLASQLMMTLNRLTVQLQEQSQQQQQLNNLLVQVLQTVATSSNAPRGGTTSSAKRSAAIANGSFSEFESKDLRKSHAKGSAEEKLRRAFQAIVAHNEETDRSQAEKWAINQNALAELTGCNRPAIKQFLNQCGTEIDAHHQLHQLLPRHNYSHGKHGIKITDVIQW